MAQNDYSFLPFGAGGIPANANSGTSIVAPRWYMGTAAPTAGTYNQGDIVFNPTPSAPSSEITRQTIAFICTTGGTPGTWTSIFNNAATAVLTTTATSGTLANGYRLTLLNPASTGTYSLPDVTAVLAGSIEGFKNIASGSVTLTPLGTNNYEATSIAAITLAQNALVELQSAGGTSTTWYKVG